MTNVRQANHLSFSAFTWCAEW